MVWDSYIRPLPYHDSSFSLFGVTNSPLRVPPTSPQRWTSIPHGASSPFLTTLGWVSHILSSLRHCLRMILVRIYYYFTFCFFDRWIRYESSTTEFGLLRLQAKSMPTNGSKLLRNICRSEGLCKNLSDVRLFYRLEQEQSATLRHVKLR